MDCKDFFKPTKWKIILTLIIPIYLTYTVHFAMVLPPAKSVWYAITFYPIPILLIYFGSIYSYFQPLSKPLFPFPEKVLHFLLDYILPLLINYVIVCLIIFLFKKIKSKK